MEKVLRSLILEKFPFELRVEIELLSRRRDIVNKEKTEELMKILRKYNMQDITPLGPGTNRYAFKLDGFVVKVATDNDGRIDNLKEFKMAKRLFPYVTKTYEVSENGTLLVAEYIQPFESYREMCVYSERIKEILEKLSAVYLIGDVGLTSKNYSNWGLRIGTQEPVCLDFAYVYEVKSELFVCRHCKAGAVLMPTPDFTKLQCSNPACGKYYLFEDIRAKIGNDIHRHEIGDLTEEGYALTESGVLTTLTEERSNYLKRKEVVKKEETKEEVEEFVPDNFVMEHSPKYYIEHEEEPLMSIDRVKSVADALNRDNPNNLPIIRGRVISAKPKEVIPTDDTLQPPVIQARVIQTVQKPFPVKEDTEEFGELAFEGHMNAGDVEVSQEEVKAAPAPPAAPVEPPKPAESESQDPFKKSFANNAGRAISNISNYSMNTFHAHEIFDHVNNSIKDKIWPEQFYRNLQNVVYHSLVEFGECVSEEVPTDGGGTKKVWRAPQDLANSKYAPTLLFIQRYWLNKHLQNIESLEDMLAAYQDIYGEPGGFQREWLETFKMRLMKKSNMKIDAVGIDTIVKMVGDIWCVSESPADPEPAPEPAPAVEPEEDEALLDAEDPFAGEFHMDAPVVTTVQNPADDSDSDDEYDEENDDTPDYITINIVHEKGFDIVKISCDDPYGFTSIPLYCDLNTVDPTPPPSLSDNRNGIWDWLIHMSPDIIFTTRDPERWLERANGGERYQNQVHMCILDEDDGVYLMGVSIIEGIYEYTDDADEPTLNLSDDLLMKLNNLICKEIGLSHISHYARTVSMKDEAKDESYIMTVMDYYESSAEDDDDEEEEEVMELSPAEKAAIQVMMGTDENTGDTPRTDLKTAAAKMAEEIVTGATPKVIDQQSPALEPETPADPEPAEPEEKKSEEKETHGELWAPIRRK